jgi:hypothetical protein
MADSQAGSSARETKEQKNRDQDQATDPDVFRERISARCARLRIRAGRLIRGRRLIL